MRLPFTEKLLWDLYKASKLTVGALDKLAMARFRGVSGMIDFFKYPTYDDLKKLEQKKLSKERFGRLITYLKYNDYLYIKEKQGKKAIIITPKGAEKILKIKRKIEGYPRRKDKKWQMVIFDIPEDIKNKRESLRHGLKRLGYQKLQRSIWISPYNSLKETEELIKYFKLGQFAKLLLVEEKKII